MVRIEDEGAGVLPPSQDFEEEIQSDDDVESSEVPRRQSEQRWPLAEDGAETIQEVNGEEKTSFGEPCRDQAEQLDPRARRCLHNQASSRSCSKNLMDKPPATRTNLDVDRSRSSALRG